MDKFINILFLITIVPLVVLLWIALISLIISFFKEVVFNKEAKE